MLHDCPRGGHVQRVLNALVQFTRGETLKIGALAAIHVQDLDIVPGLDEIALRGGVMDADGMV